MNHDPLCPKAMHAEKDWQECFCEWLKVVRADERHKIELQNERDKNETLQRMLRRRDELESIYWRNQQEINAQKIAELNKKLDKLDCRKSKRWIGKS